MRKSSNSKSRSKSTAYTSSNFIDLTGPDTSTHKAMDKVDSLFYTYASRSSRTIEPDGIESLCKDLRVDYTDVRILMLAWKMQCQKQGYFTLEEWRRGIKALRGVDSITKLKKALSDLEQEVKTPPNFENFYTYAFNYCLTEEKQKTIDLESICMLLDLVLGPVFRAQVDNFVKYIRTQSDYKVINLDQWMGFYRFCKEISFPDFSNYDDTSAWPLILDNFVDWMKEKQN